ncbi:MAG: PASTA domain-containing protein [Eubacteriaceae bacterium]|nr:PASTA domain-containing protein [Eubacteriaceae bacterium]
MSLYHLRRKKRLVFAFFIFMILFVIMAAKLTYIQAYNSINLTDQQTGQLMGEIPLTASRGDIYDRNMNILAKDASASSIYARPADIQDAEKVGLYLSDILGIDKTELIAKLTDKDKSLVLISRKVDNDKAFKIKDQDFKGIEISEDKKRYYTNGNFASYVLGFTGSDHQGLYGIERIFDEELSGEDGVLVYEKDGKNQKVPSGYQIKIQPTSGDNVVLTIDSVIQHFMESAMDEAQKTLKAKRIIAIAMDPKTGEVLGMAAKPDYNLNDPQAISEIFAQCMSTDLEGLNLGEKQLAMWSNPAVGFNYEPGSTFKLITAAAALEEGVVAPDTAFYDNGFILIDGIKIRCHIFPRAHGDETFVEAVANSCNPVLVQTIMRMNPGTFYKYLYNFGFGDKTKIQLDGEQSGIVSPNNNLKNASFATKSYGQGIAVTPIQLISALSAALNDGYYHKPTIVKKILTSDNKTVIKDYADAEASRQIISKETSDVLKEIMKKVISNSAALTKQAGEFSIGGKTGTAQKIIDGKYAQGKYITSFFGVAPVDDPKVSILLIVDEPADYSPTGATTAAPVAIDILINSLKYLNVPTESKVDFGETDIVPDLRNQNISLAKEVLGYLKLNYKIIGDDTLEHAVIVDQSPMPGSIIKENTVVQLTISQGSTSDNKSAISVPNVVDMSIQKANETLQKVGLGIQVNGSGGISISQSPGPGEMAEPGTKIIVEFKHIE